MTFPRVPNRALLRLLATALSYALARLSGRSVGLALVYHNVEERGGEVARELVPAHASALFADQVGHLARWYRVVPAARLPEAVAGRRRGGRLPVAITFDDDLATHVDHAAPILATAGVPATFFLTGACLERPYEFWWETLQAAVDAGIPIEDPAIADGATIHDLGDAVRSLPPESRNELVAMLRERVPTGSPRRGLSAHGASQLVRAGHEIGFHTLRHDSLTLLDDGALSLALADGRERIETVAGRPIRSIAYPHGRADARVACAAREAGFALAFTTSPTTIDAGCDPHLIGRVEPTRESARAFAVQLAELLAPPGLRRLAEYRRRMVRAIPERGLPA